MPLMNRSTLTDFKQANVINSTDKNACSNLGFMMVSKNLTSSLPSTKIKRRFSAIATSFKTKKVLYEEFVDTDLVLKKCPDLLFVDGSRQMRKTTKVSCNERDIFYVDVF